MTTSAVSQAKVILDDSRLKAVLRFKSAEHDEDLSFSTVTTLLADAGVVLNEAISDRVQQFCDRYAAEKLAGKEFLIAEAQPPILAADAELLLSEELRHRCGTPPDEDDSGNEQVDYYAQCRLAVVEPGDIIGTVKPSQPGEDGVNLAGVRIPSGGTSKELVIGDGVRLDDDGVTLNATAGGLVRVRGNTIAVVDQVEVDGDVGFKSGSIDSPSDVVIKGTVRDLFNVKSSKSISVGEAIENASVTAGDDVVVGGGIAGKDTGVVRAGGNIVCKFCDGATLRADADITITKEAISSDIRCGGRLIIPRGAMIGGSAYARAGAQICEAGSDAEIPTRITIGVDPVVLARAALIDEEIEKHRAAAERIRSAIAPLIANMKRLAPAQRERATELMFQADSIQCESDEKLANKNAMLQKDSQQEEPALVVTNRIYPGVTLIVEDMEFITREEIRGPVKITKRAAAMGKAGALICTNQFSGSTRELLHRQYRVEIPTNESAATAGPEANASANPDTTKP